MGMSVKTNTAGLDRIVRQAQGLDRATALAAAQDNLPKMKAEAPVDTGALRQSGVIVDSGENVSIVFVGGAKGRQYAIYQELGTRRMRAQPYLRPVFDRTNFDAIIQKVAKARLGL